MKRAREDDDEDSPNPGEDKSIPGPHRHAPNQFGQWLLENIYKYARVRDSDRLADVTKKYEDLSKRFHDLLVYVQASGLYEGYHDFCVGCGRTNITEAREDCMQCGTTFVACSTCGPDVCVSEKHVICFTCARLNMDCDGSEINQCTD